MFDDVENIEDEKNAIENNEDEVDDGVWAPSCHCFCGLVSEEGIGEEVGWLYTAGSHSPRNKVREERTETGTRKVSTPEILLKLLDIR